MNDRESFYRLRREALEMDLRTLQKESRLVAMVYAKKLCDLGRKSSEIAQQFIELNREIREYERLRLNDETKDEIRGD